MFALRYFRLLALAPLVSCSVYSEDMLGDSQSVSAGGTSLALGGSSNMAQAGKSSLGGTHGVLPDPETAGDANGPGTGGANASLGGTSSGGFAGSAGSATGGTASPTAGAGGGGGTGGVVVPSGVDMVDDMEDGNFSISPKPPRYGYWYAAGDMTVGGQLPKAEELMATLTPARGMSKSAVHFYASGFKGWGSSLGLSFTDSSMQKRIPYDAGNALGISFWVRGSITGNVKLKVQLPITGTDPSGKLCGGTAQGQCLDHFATQIDVTPTWTQVPILFTDLHQAGWGVPIEGGFDASHIIGIEWSAGTANLDIWIDDLALLRP